MNTRPYTLLGCLCSVLLGLATACSTPGPPVDPLEEAFSESKETILAGVEEGFEESESVDEYVVTARFNPCRCEAPTHEIYIHGRWTRVFLEGDRKTLNAVDKQLGDDSLTLATVELRGALSGDETTSNGVEFPAFEIHRIETK
jgi:hypothetical protein